MVAALERLLQGGLVAGSEGMLVTRVARDPGALQGVAGWTSAILLQIGFLRWACTGNLAVFRLISLIPWRLSSLEFFDHTRSDPFPTHTNIRRPVFFPYAVGYVGTNCGA
jgi:hypothetical protein